VKQKICKKDNISLHRFTGREVSLAIFTICAWEWTIKRQNRQGNRNTWYWKASLGEIKR